MEDRAIMGLEGTSSRYNGKNHNTKELNKGKEEFVQRHTSGDSLAESIIIGKKLTSQSPCLDKLVVQMIMYRLS
jgi:hypothetical protein